MLSCPRLQKTASQSDAGLQTLRSGLPPESQADSDEDSTASDYGDSQGPLYAADSQVAQSGEWCSAGVVASHFSLFQVLALTATMMWHFESPAFARASAPGVFRTGSFSYREKAT